MILGFAFLLELFDIIQKRQGLKEMDLVSHSKGIERSLTFQFAPQQKLQGLLTHSERSSFSPARGVMAAQWMDESHFRPQKTLDLAGHQTLSREINLETNQVRSRLGAETSWKLLDFVFILLRNFQVHFIFRTK